MFLNHYECPRCDCAWSDAWSCQVDDDCPACGLRHISPEDSFEFGIGLSLKLDRLVGESKPASDFLRAVDADRVGVEVGFRCCDGKHGIECGVWSTALEKNDHLVL